MRVLVFLRFHKEQRFECLAKGSHPSLLNGSAAIKEITTELIVK